MQSLSCCRDGHGYPCIDQGPSLGGFAKSEDGRAGEDLFSSEGDDDVELEKSNVLLLGPTGDPRCIAPTEQACGKASFLAQIMCQV